MARRRFIKRSDHYVHRVEGDEAKRYLGASRNRGRAYDAVALGVVAKRAHTAYKFYKDQYRDPRAGLVNAGWRAFLDYPMAKFHSGAVKQIDEHYTNQRLRGKSKKEAGISTAKEGAYHAARHGVSVAAARGANKGVHYLHKQYGDQYLPGAPSALVHVAASMAGWKAYQTAYRMTDKSRTLWNKGRRALRKKMEKK